MSLSIITVSELFYGAQKSAAVEKNLAALENFLLPFNLYSFDENAAKVYGRLCADLAKKGQPIGALDTLIAAHALSSGHTLVTNNEKEFSRVEGLKVENWTLS